MFGDKECTLVSRFLPFGQGPKTLSGQYVNAARRFYKVNKGCMKCDVSCGA